MSLTHIELNEIKHYKGIGDPHTLRTVSGNIEKREDRLYEVLAQVASLMMNQVERVDQKTGACWFGDVSEVVEDKDETVDQMVDRK